MPQSILSLGGKDKVYGSINWLPNLIDVLVVISSQKLEHPKENKGRLGRAAIAKGDILSH